MTPDATTSAAPDAYAALSHLPALPLFSQLTAVVSQPGKPKGRGNKGVPTPSPVEAAAREAGVPDAAILCPRSARDVSQQGGGIVWCCCKRRCCCVAHSAAGQCGMFFTRRLPMQYEIDEMMVVHAFVDDPPCS